MPEQASPKADRLWPIVTALGISQIIGYGTLYYAFALFAPLVSREYAVSSDILFAFLSAGFLAGGMLSPFAGNLMDRWGAARIMTIGSAAMSVLFLAAAVSPNIAFFAVVTVVMQVVAIAVEYDAAFAAISQAAGARAQQIITRLTLVAGFSSTLFWPLTGWLLDQFGWRLTYAAFAAMHLFLLVPLHFYLWRRQKGFLPQRHEQRQPSAIDDAPPQHGPRSFWLVAISFAMSSALITALGTHLVPLLTAKGLGASAYIVSMLMGPAQVAIRLTNATVWRNLHPLSSALIAALALPVSAALLLWSSGSIAVAAAFSILFGVGQGLFSITRGTVPLTLFGPQGYGARLGKLAAVRTVLSAAGPVVFAFVWHSYGINPALALSLVIGLVAAFPLVVLRRNNN